MANELTVQWSMAFKKAGVTYTEAASLANTVGESFGPLEVTIAGTTYVSNVLSVATTETLVPFGGLSAPHWAFFWNLDDTNYLQIRPGSGLTALCRLYPGEGSPIPLDNAITALYAIANIAACPLRYLILPF